MAGKTAAGHVMGDGRSIESGEGDLATAQSFIKSRALAVNGYDFSDQFFCLFALNGMRSELNPSVRFHRVVSSNQRRFSFHDICHAGMEGQCLYALAPAPSLRTKAMASAVGIKTRPRIRPGLRRRTRLINPRASQSSQKQRLSPQTGSPPPLAGRQKNSGRITLTVEETEAVRGLLA